MDCKANGFTTCSGRFSAGYCNKHYLQIRRHGKLIISNRDKRTAVAKGDTIEIPLGVNSKDGYAIIDKQFAHLAKDNFNINHYGYARRSRDKKLLHRLIMEVNQTEVIDHKNNNRLDNRLNNLRVCTQAENSKNQRLRKNNISGYKGVSEHTNGFRARIKVNYKQIELGIYTTALEAAKAYDKAAKGLHGEYARLNDA